MLVDAANNNTEEFGKLQARLSMGDAPKKGDAPKTDRSKDQDLKGSDGEIFMHGMERKQSEPNVLTTHLASHVKNQSISSDKWASKLQGYSREDTQGPERTDSAASDAEVN